LVRNQKSDYLGSEFLHHFHPKDINGWKKPIRRLSKFQTMQEEIPLHFLSQKIQNDQRDVFLMFESENYKTLNGQILKTEIIF